LSKYFDTTGSSVATGADTSPSGLRHDFGATSETGGYSEAIAICGIAFRLPGGVRDDEAFWDVLYNGQDMRGEIPMERFNAAGFNKSMGLKGAFDIQHGYFLDDDLGCLDTSFFSFRKTELETMDPQIRQILEVTRECLESAGETEYRGKCIGCYVGTFGDDWLILQSKENLQPAKGYRLTLDLLLANRVSYEYDLKGPR
jgi:acyl transferase domain-containing protein